MIIKSNSHTKKIKIKNIKEETKRYLQMKIDRFQKGGQYFKVIGYKNSHHNNPRGPLKTWKKARYKETVKTTKSNKSRKIGYSRHIYNNYKQASECNRNIGRIRNSHNNHSTQ